MSGIEHLGPKMAIKKHRAGAEHPSYNCYTNHRCRCPGCVEIGTKWARDYRAGLINPPPRQAKKLDEATVRRLRIMVGLDPDNPAF